MSCHCCAEAIAGGAGVQRSGHELCDDCAAGLMPCCGAVPFEDEDDPGYDEESACTCSCGCCGPTDFGELICEQCVEDFCADSYPAQPPLAPSTTREPWYERFPVLATAATLLAVAAWLAMLLIFAWRKTS